MSETLEKLNNFLSKQTRGIGNWSTNPCKQTTGELENQISTPQKVNAFEEQKKHNPQRDNAEPFFEKEFTPEEEIKVGMREETEHKDVTDGDKEKTRKIVDAHLKEDPHYYSKLKKVGLIHKEYIDPEIIYEQIDLIFDSKDIQKMSPHILETKQELPRGVKDLSEKI